MKAKRETNPERKQICSRKPAAEYFITDYQVAKPREHGCRPSCDNNCTRPPDLAPDPHIINTHDSHLKVLTSLRSIVMALLILQTLSLAPYILLAFPIVWYFGRIIRFYTSPLRDIPGPLLARFSRSWLLGEIWRGTAFTTNRDLHLKYGLYILSTIKFIQLISTIKAQSYESHQTSTASKTPPQSR